MTRKLCSCLAHQTESICVKRSVGALKALLDMGLEKRLQKKVISLLFEVSGPVQRPIQEWTNEEKDVNR